MFSLRSFSDGTPLLLTLCLSAVPLAAQAIPTTPYASFNVEGLAYSLAVANNDRQLTQTIYESSLVYRSLPQWSTLYLRPDDGALQVPFVAFQRHLTLRLSSSGVPSPELANPRSFQANRGTDYTTVLGDKMVSFPAFTPNGSGAAAFSVAIPLDQPWSLPFFGHLLLEVETRAEGSGPTQWQWFPDADFWPSRSWTIFPTTFGTGCPAQQSYSANYEPNSSTLSTTLRFARPIGSGSTHPAAAWLGTNNQRWGPLALPLPLDFFGATGCSLYTEPAVVVTGTTGGGSGESFTMRVPVPRQFGLLGQSVYAQTLVFDPNAGNPAGWRVSPGASFYFSSPPDPYQALTLTAKGSFGDVPQAATPNQAVILGVQ